MLDNLSIHNMISYQNCLERVTFTAVADTKETIAGSSVAGSLLVTHVIDDLDLID